MSYQTKSRRGAVALMMAICLTVIMGVAAICLDGGLLLDQRRYAQSLADAAALAAASDLYLNYRTSNGSDTSGKARASALATVDDTDRINFPDGSTRTRPIVTVNIPPKETLEQLFKQPGYAEVIVTVNVNRGFSSIWGTGTIPVSARAVARGLWTPFRAGIIVLAPTGTTLSGVGNAAAVSGGAVIVNSTSSNATSGNGNVSMTAPEFDVSGAIPPDAAYFHGTTVTNKNPTPDPLSWLDPPSTGGLTRYEGGRINKTTTLLPGIYTKGIQISGQASVTLSPGIYYMESGGLSTTGGASLAGNGVLIYNANSGDSIDLKGTGSVTLSPMQTGLYEGMVLYQDRASTAKIDITGNGNMNITGSFYAANASIGIVGNGGTNAIGSQYIVHDLSMTGNGIINVNLTNDTSAKSRMVGLVE